MNDSIHEYAEKIDLGVRWDTGAPTPVLLASDSRTLLAFYLPYRDPNCNGTDVHVRDATTDIGVAVVQFWHCIVATLGDPNDEVLHGHRLWGKGLDAYGAFIVQHSTWITELQQINSVHDRYNPEKWVSYKHYILTFHD